MLSAAVSQAVALVAVRGARPVSAGWRPASCLRLSGLRTSFRFQRTLRSEPPLQRAPHLLGLGNPVASLHALQAGGERRVEEEAMQTFRHGESIY